MTREVVSLLDVPQGGSYIDCTTGGGGHIEAVLTATRGNCRVLAVDCDDVALERASARLAKWKGVCRFVRGNFENIEKLARDNGFENADGILMDLGVSSLQIDTASRGFSFMREGPLDMRMDPSLKETAADIVNNYRIEDLKQMIRELGEEPMAGRIAFAIARERSATPLLSTRRLAEIVCAAKTRKAGRIHPATKTFQALRIAVNRELTVLEQGLKGAFSVLKKGGRLAVLSYHSLEDRRVKTFFKNHAGYFRSMEAGGSEWIGEHPAGKLLNKKIIRPTQEETEENPRAQSAKLRVIERIE